ncbi:MAG: hypothetical protein WDN45_13400 [Caulobacteraceae bacterium]
MPEPFRTASRFNPLFYLIDGFRYGFIGHSEQPLLLGAVFVLGLAAGARRGGLAAVRLGIPAEDLRRPDGLSALRKTAVRQTSKS